MCPYMSIGSIEIAAYNFFNNFALFIGILFNLSMYKYKIPLLSKYSKNLIFQKNYPKEKCAKLEFVILTLILNYFGGICNSFLAKYTPGVVANYFGVILISPLLVILFLYYIHVNPLKQFDLSTPSYALILTGCKFACLMHGCCEGKVSVHGLYFSCRQQYEIPSQLIEMATAFAIFLILVYILKHCPKRIPGILFPIYIILYSSTRFISEFTRVNTPVIWNLQPYHLYCISGVIIGSIELLLMLKFGQKLSDFFDKKFN